MQTQRAQPTIQVAKLLLTESGTYNPLFSRPYVSHFGGETMNNILRRVDESPTGNITGALLAGVASQAIAPSANHQGELPIVGGWGSRRIRFMMEVHVTIPTGSSFIYYFQGYTSHLGVGLDGSIDPTMQFIINSYLRVNRAVQHSAYGDVVRDVITESAHIVNGQIVNQVQGGSVYTMRPQDIFTGIQSAYLSQAYNSYNKPGGFDDTRIRMNEESLRSNRANNMPANYMAKIVDTYQTGRQLAEFGQSDQDIYGRCHGLTHEASAYENLFIRAISNMRGDHCVTNFTFNELTMIDPNVKHVTNYITLGATQVAQLHTQGQTEYWSGADPVTMAAVTLSNTVPAIMMELMISKLHFRSTNHDAGGMVSVAIIDAQGLTNLDMSQNLELFKRRFDKEIMFDLTGGNSDLFMIDMVVDLFGESRISLSLNGSAMTPFTTPSFCDSLLTPVITMQQGNFQGVVHDFETLMTKLSSSGVQTSPMNTLI